MKRWLTWLVIAIWQRPALASSNYDTKNGEVPLSTHSAVPETGERKAQTIRPHGTLVELILNCLDDDKAQEIISIDLSGKTALADHMVIASGRSNRHVSAISDHILRTLKQEGYGRCRIEGMPHCNWVLIDAGDVIVHVFKPEVREFYNLEKMWGSFTPDSRQMS